MRLAPQFLEIYLKAFIIVIQMREELPKLAYCLGYLQAMEDLEELDYEEEN